MNLKTLIEKLSQQNKDAKIAYPDCDDERVFEAINRLIELDESPIVIGTPKELERYSKLKNTGLRTIELGPNTFRYQNEYQELIKYLEKKGVSMSLIMAAICLQKGEIDGIVAGNISTTSAVCLSLIKGVGSREGISKISSHFLMAKDEDLLLYSDAGLQVDPNSEELAEIAYNSIISAQSYGMQPKVAFLSYSTFGSGGDTHLSLKVREASELLKTRLKKENMDIPVIGEVQFDAAYLPEIGAKKMGDAALSEKANVFIFPDLNSGNIAYKITERLAGYTAIGPILQGLAKPGNDLSRGCSVQDIIYTHHITKNQ